MLSAAIGLLVEMEELMNAARAEQDLRVKALRAVLREGAPDLESVPLTLEPPKDDEVLVDVRAVALTRFELGWWDAWHDGALVPGHEFAGTVRAVGRDCRRLQPGDSVVGWVRLRQPGALATRVIVRETQLAIRPRAIGAATAAALPLAALRVAGALYDEARVGIGSRVLVEDLDGDCVWLAIAMADALGAIVTVSTRGRRRRALALSLGAREVLDPDEAAASPRHDVLVRCGHRRAMRNAPRTDRLIDLGEDQPSELLQENPADVHDPQRLEQLLYLVEQGFLRVPIAATFAFEQSAHAFSYAVRQKRRPGRIIVLLGADLAGGG